MLVVYLNNINYNIMKQKKQKLPFRKKKLFKSIEIIRVKIMPEQAVLTCCDEINRAGTTVTGWQCVIITGCGNGAFSAAS